MSNRVSQGGVRGDLLRWARKEQSLTLHEVQRRGGPCPGYQSEVEQGKKFEVRSDLLAAWAAALGITERFAHGWVPRLGDGEHACRGLAGDAGALAQRARGDLAAIPPVERTRQVLCLIGDRSQHLPRVVLAWVLGVSVAALDSMMTAQQPIPPDMAHALSLLTAMPPAFFLDGPQPVSEPAREMGDYLPVVERARSLGLTPDDLLDLLDLREPPLDERLPRRHA